MTKKRSEVFALMTVTTVLVVAILFWSWWRDEHPDAAIAAVLFLLFGFAIVVMARQLLDVKGEVLFVALLFMPIVAYLILAGKIATFSGGGVSLEFNDPVANLNIGNVPVPMSTISAGGGTPGVVVSCDPMAFANQVAQQESMPAVLTPTPSSFLPIPVTYLQFTVDPQSCIYLQEDVQSQLRELTGEDHFKFVILVKSEETSGQEEFYAYIPSRAAAYLFSDQMIEQTLDAINTDSGDLSRPDRYPGIGFDPLSGNATNLEALEMMAATNLDALVVVNDESSVIGVLLRDEIVSNMMLELAGTLTPE